MNALTHLHIHSEFSLSDSILRVGEIVDYVELRFRLPLCV